MSATFHPCKHCNAVGAAHVYDPVNNTLRCFGGTLTYEPDGEIVEGPFDGDEEHGFFDDVIASGGDLLMFTPDAYRAAMVRLAIREQWRAMVTLRIAASGDVDVKGGIPEPLPESDAELAIMSTEWPCAVDVVADLLGGAP